MFAVEPFERLSGAFGACFDCERDDMLIVQAAQRLWRYHLISATELHAAGVMFLPSTGYVFDLGGGIRGRRRCNYCFSWAVLPTSPRVEGTLGEQARIDLQCPNHDGVLCGSVNVSCRVESSHSAPALPV